MSGTPIADFIDAYTARKPLRLHMPGHKGRGETERADITEVKGADVLYRAEGIIRMSESGASEAYGSARTLYSAEGSSLCIRAMVMMAVTRAKASGRPPLILAGRNAHTAFCSAAALAGAEVEWLWGGDLLTCDITGEEVRRKLEGMPELPAAVYLTGPDYLGQCPDIRDIAAVCREKDVPLLVDNAHGAYLKFLPEDRHPLTLGADLVCDSAHKTLHALTGCAFLHMGPGADPYFLREGERMMGLFASTSPSWLLLRSLDECVAGLDADLRERLAETAGRTGALRERLAELGFRPMPGEKDPLKIALRPKAKGYTGDALHDLLREGNMECEFSDPDQLVMMFSADTGAEDFERIGNVFEAVPAREPIPTLPPLPGRPERMLSIRDAVTRPATRIPTREAEGRILADPCVGCPPAVPILFCGERVDRQAMECFRYYGIHEIAVTDR